MKNRRQKEKENERKNIMHTHTVLVPHPLKLFTNRNIQNIAGKKSVKTSGTTICRYFVSVFACYLRSINSKNLQQ